MKSLFVFLFVIFNTLSLFSFENEEVDVSITLTKPAKFTYDQYFAKQVDSLNEMLSSENYQTRNREAAMQMLDSVYKAMLLQLNDSVNIKSSDLYKLKKEIKELDKVFKDKQRIKEYLKRIDFKMDYNYQIYFIKTFEDFLRYYIVGYYSEYIKTVQFVLDSNKLNKSKEEFRKTAIKNKTQFVLNINLINLKRIDSLDFINMDLQLYDYKTDSLLIDSLFISDNVNNYLTFSCEDFSLNCFVNNSIMNSYRNIINNLLLHSTNPKQIIDLRKAQNNILVKMLKNTYNKDIIVSILIEQKDKNNLDSNIKIENIFFAVNNDSFTKFIAFFNNDLHYNNADSSSENYHRITTYSLNAEKYQDRWYFEKPCMISNETKINDLANENLICSVISDSYFNVNDTTYNEQFWDVGQFEKVQDITKTEKWNLYRELYENEEIRYRKYIGLTKFVADELIKIEEEKFKVKE